MVRRKPRKASLTLKVVEAARPHGSEYTLWDGTLPHFGLRVHPSGRKSYIVQTRAQGRMRKITLGRFPELGLTEARRDAAAVLSRIWNGENVTRSRKTRPPRFDNFEAVYRERKRYQWKPSSLETYDIYMRHRVMPAFGRFRLDTITHVRVSVWFDAISAEKPGAANRAFEILRALLRTARQWGELPDTIPDACANIVMNPRRPVARYLGAQELERLGAVLDRRRDEHPWHVAALRLLSLTGARLSEVLNLKWSEIGDLSAQEGGGARLPDTKTGPRTLWFGPDAAKLVSSLPRRGEDERIFPDDLTTHSLYAVWTRLRAEAGLDGVRIHDLRHSFASQGVMNGEGLPTVGRLLGHRHRATTAIYAHLDDATLQDAAARAASVIAQAMEFTVEAPVLMGGEKEFPQESRTREERCALPDRSRRESRKRTEEDHNGRNWF